MSSRPQDIEDRSPRLQQAPPTIDLSAFNQARKNEIAKDSEKLLALTAALKAELDSDSSKAQSEDVAQKIKEIEKLAHKVKERMLADPTPSQLLH
jgi:DNA-binding transcriptional regulator GbsR (MarR family)